jgi:hypothetical protein
VQPDLRSVGRSITLPGLLYSSDAAERRADCDYCHTDGDAAAASVAASAGPLDRSSAAAAATAAIAASGHLQQTASRTAASALLAHPQPVFPVAVALYAARRSRLPDRTAVVKLAPVRTAAIDVTGPRPAVAQRVLRALRSKDTDTVGGTDLVARKGICC